MWKQRGNGESSSIHYSYLYLVFFQLGQTLGHPVAASAKLCRAEPSRGSSKAEPVWKVHTINVGNKAGQRGCRNLFSDHKHLQDAQTIPFLHWNEEIIFGGFSCPPAPPKSNSIRGGCWGWGGSGRLLHLSVPLSHLSLRRVRGNWLRGSKEKSWIYSQAKMSLRAPAQGSTPEHPWNLLLDARKGISSLPVCNTGTSSLFSTSAFINN